MGLFGPSYSWEETQRKNDAVKELDKQTDKIVDAIKDSNRNDKRNYSGQKYREKTEQIQAKTNAINAYVNSLDDNDKNAISRISPEARGIDADSFKAFLIMGKPFSGWMQHHHQEGQIRLLLCLASWIAIFILLFVDKILIIFPALYISALYRIPFYILPAIYSSKKIKNTDCYRGLLEDLKKEDFSKIKHIGASAECIRIIYENNSKKNLYYADYKFPNLPYDRTAVLLASLLRELEVHKSFDLVIKSGIKSDLVYLFLFWRNDYTNCRSVKSRVEIDTTMFTQKEQEQGGLKVYNYSVYATNEVLRKKKEKETIVNIKESQKKKKDVLKKARKEGKTW